MLGLISVTWSKVNLSIPNIYNYIYIYMMFIIHDDPANDPKLTISKSPFRLLQVDVLAVPAAASAAVPGP